MTEVLIIFLATKLHVLTVVVALAVLALASRRKQLQLLTLSVMTLPLSILLGKFLSLVITNPRPFTVDGVEPLIQHVADNGFPSEHTLLVATVAGIVFVHNRTVGLLLFGFSVLVGVGRVLSGVHHVVDVVGSFVIAGTAVYVSVIFLRKLLCLKMAAART